MDLARRLAVLGSALAILTLGCGDGSSGGPGGDGGGQDAGGKDAGQEPGGDGTGPGGDGAPDAAAETMAGDTWTNWANDFFGTYCNRCHSMGGTGYRSGVLDFTMYDKVVAASVKTRCGTAATMQSGCGTSPHPKQFPIAAPYPSDADRARLVAWIDAGLPR